MSNDNPASTDSLDSQKGQFDISESTYKTSHTAVRKARRFALQGLYEWLMTDRRFEQTGLNQWQTNAPHDIAARTRATNAMHTVHLAYYHEMMREIPLQIDELEQLIAQHLDRQIDKIDSVEHVVLLIGAYELKNSVHIPYKVVIDEAMKLNTHFGATDAHKLINAVMDKLAAQLRRPEVEADSGDNKTHNVYGEEKQSGQSSTNSATTKNAIDATPSATTDAVAVNADSASKTDDATNDDATNDVQLKIDSVESTANKPRLSRRKKD